MGFKRDFAGEVGGSYSGRDLRSSIIVFRGTATGLRLANPYQSSLVRPRTGHPARALFVLTYHRWLLSVYPPFQTKGSAMVPPAKVALGLAVAVVSLTNCGCGTIDNLSAPGKYDERALAEPRQLVY